MAVDKGQKQKKAAAARRATTKSVEKLGGREAVEASLSEHGEPPKLDQFAKKKFDKDNKKHIAVVDSAIAAARKAGHRESKDLAPYVWNATGFARKDYRGRNLPLLNKYISAQCAEEDRSGRTRFYDGITDIVAAEDEDLLKFVKRKGDVIIVKSCCGKVVEYGEASGLQRRATIAFSVEQYGLPEATRLARLETFKTLGLRDTTFLKQLKKLK
jgi:hypothetical protein